jgi:hypothetical protein
VIVASLARSSPTHTTALKTKAAAALSSESKSDMNPLLTSSDRSPCPTPQSCCENEVQRQRQRTPRRTLRLGRIHLQRFIGFASMALCFAANPGLAQAEEEVVLTEDGAAPAAPASKSSKANSQPVVEENAGVMVRPFAGPKSQTIHDRVISTLEAEGIILIPEGFEEGVKLADAPGPYVEVARKNQIKAYLHGQTKMTKKEWSVTIKVRNGKDGKPVTSITLSNYSLPGLLKKIDKGLMAALDEPLLQTSVPGSKAAGKGAKPGKSSAAAESEEDGALAVTLEAEPGSKDVAADSGPIAPKETTKRESGAASPLDVTLGLGFTQRQMQYQKAVGDVYEYSLRPHGLTVPTLRLGAHWYPGAYLYDGILANVGLTFNFYQSVGGSTDVRDASGVVNSLASTFTELTAGLRGRITFPSLELGLNGAWGFQSLELEGDNQKSAANQAGDPGIVPDAGYTFFRFGPDVHLELGTPIQVGLFYRMVTLKDDEGYMAEPRWFPAAAAIGFDAFAAFNIPITSHLDLQLGGEARYYGIKANAGGYDNTVDPMGNSNPTAGGTDGLNQAVAAGVTDVYLGAFVAGYYTVPGLAK